MTSYANDYDDFNYEAAQMIEEQRVSDPIIVSFSEIFKWQTCQRQYAYRFDLGLAPIEESDAIKTGVKGHRLLQSFHELLREGKTKEEALELVQKQARKLMEPQKKGLLSDFTIDYNLLKAWTLVDNYIRETDFTSQAILVENRFLFPASLLDNDPILENVQIGFTPDVVFERTGGRLDVEDYKFIQRAWSASKINRFPQVKLYQIFMSLMGYDVSRGILRFFNVQTAKITDKNYILTETEEQNLIYDFMEGVKEVVRYKTVPIETRKQAPRTMNYTACQYCAFEYICSLEAEGKDASHSIETQFAKSTYDYNR